MARPDLNQLVTLDVLLAERSVAAAAKRLSLSPSAMSRALARLRATMGDPLLARAGRGLVPTPRALELRDAIGPLVESARRILSPAAAPDLARLERTFTLRTRDGFVETFGPALIARVKRQAPRVRLRFVQKLVHDAASLRDGAGDLELGVVDESTHPDLRTRALFRDRFVGVVRKGHALARGRVTPKRYAATEHALVSRGGRDRGAADDALSRLGLAREIVAIVGGFSSAVALARSSDLVATVPERHTTRLRVGMHTFELPFEMPAITVSMLWHPRLDADAAHRWLRACVRETCGD